MSETVKVAGLAELRANLQALPAEIQQKVLRRGVAAGAAVIRAAAKNLAPVKSGTLRRASIIKFIRKESNATQVKYIVTFRRGKSQQKSNRDAFYASFVEFGHRSRNGGFVPPHRFLKPAFDQNYGKAIDVMKARMTDELLKLPEFKA